MGTTNNKTQEEPLSIQERLKEKSIKTMEKVTEEQTLQRLQFGQSPTEILKSLMDSMGEGGVSQKDVLNQVSTLAAQKVPVEGSVTGILPALIQSLGGKGFHPMAPQQASMGFDDAVKVLQLQQQMGQNQMQIPKTAAETVKVLLEVAQKSGSKELFQQAGGQISPGVDWQTGQPSLEAKIAEKAALTKTEITTKAETEKKEQAIRLSKDLDNYFAIGDLLPTEEGISRYKKGIELFGKKIGQSDIIGAAAADLDAINKRLRVRIVKYNGDVGNINIVEQKAAEKILYSLDDSTKLRALKKAYLTDLKDATTNNNGGAVRELINKFVNEPEFRIKYPDIYKSYVSRQGEQQVGKNGEKETNNIPQVGNMFNGEKILKVKRIK